MQRSLTPYLVSFLILLAGMAYLLLAGRNLICPCGYVKIWDGWPKPGENSQHLLDWYTLSHIIHGFLFYALLWLVARRASFGWRLAMATAIEVVWEVIENSETVIEHYRTTTISVDYNGDSVVNTAMDVFAMMFGFWLAKHFPIWLSVVTIILLEIAALIAVRDGLTLNIIGFIYPMDWIVEWQSEIYAPVPAPAPGS